MRVLQSSMLVLFLTAIVWAANYHGTYALYGSINDKYDIQMEITIKGQSVYGNYKYVSQNGRLSLNGKLDSQGFVTLYETDPKGQRTGVFRGTISSPDGMMNLNGTWSTPDGKTSFPFSCSEPGC